MVNRRNRFLSIWTKIAGAIFVLTVPLSIFWQLGPPASPAVLAMYVSPGVYLTDAAAILLILTALLQPAGHSVHRQKRGWLAPLKISLPLLILPLLGLVSSLTALSPALALYTSLRWLLAVGVFLAWKHLRLDLDLTVRIFLAGLLIQAVIGALQFIHKGPLGLPGELALPIERARAAVFAIGNTTFLRAYGLTFHPNVLGGFLAAGLILGLPLLKQPAFRFVWWGLGIGLFLTFSRSAWLAGAIVLPLSVAWLLWKQPALRRALLITLGVVLAAGIVSGIFLIRPILARLDIASSFSELTSIAGRGELQGLAFEILGQKPLTGIGAGNFPLAAAAARINDVAHYVHHVPLLLAAELGLAGGLIWYWLWLAPALSIEKRLRGTHPWPIVLAAAWFALGLIGLWDSYPWSLESGRLLAVTLLAWYSQVSTHPDPSRAVPG